MPAPGAIRGPRVVSLVPSATETLLAWGVEPLACTRFCEQPGLAQVGGTKDPDVAAVVALAPDLVVMCEEENRREDADALAAAGVAVEVVRIDGVDDVAPSLRSLAARLALDAERLHADGLLGGLEPPPTVLAGASPRAFVPIWRRPWMTLGERCYGASLLRSLGLDVLVVDDGARYPTVALDDVAALAPEVVLAPSEPYPFGPRHVAELSTVAPVVLVDGQDLFWWGVRTPVARRRLGRALVAGGVISRVRADRAQPVASREGHDGRTG